MAGFSGGQIVVADWRDPLPKEPNELCPPVVVEDEALFDPAYLNVILVPRTGAGDPRSFGCYRTDAAKRLHKALLCAVALCGDNLGGAGDGHSVEDYTPQAIRRQIAVSVGLG